MFSFETFVVVLLNFIIIVCRFVFNGIDIFSIYSCYIGVV